MLFAVGELRYDPAHIRLHIGMGTRCEFKVIERAACTYDTRWLPSRTQEGEGRLLLHFYLCGEVELGGARLTPPVVVATTEAQYCGGARRRPVAIRAGGAAFMKIELTLQWDDALLNMPEAPLVLETPATLLQASLHLAERMRARTHEDPNPWVTTWMGLLVDQGWLKATALAALSTRAPAGIERLWHAAGPAIANIDLNVGLRSLSTRAGVTSRQLARNIDELLHRAGHPIGFRALLAEWRLRIAVMLLSAPHANIDEVAQVVGFASAESLAASFRDAGLPPPRDVQVEVSRPIG